MSNKIFEMEQNYEIFRSKHDAYLSMEEENKTLRAKLIEVEAHKS